ncbi:MAG: hypothetical protein IPM49_17010 [Flavobacteriales bacterium]|nr:hypothetical protein [Flavobacteriales bacterium]
MHVVLTGCALAVGCAAEHDGADPPVARAYGNTLYWSDLRQVVPVDAAPHDSAILARSFVDNWLREQVLLASAERNLPEVHMDVEARIRDYRNSLIIYAYEQAVVEQKLDTVVTDAQLQQHYESNRKDFALREDILRARWFKVHEVDDRELRKVQRWFTGGRPEDLHELEVWLALKGVSINDPGPAWSTLGQFAAQVPVATGEVWARLRSNERLVLADSADTYFVEVLEHRSAGDEPPLALVAEDIRTIVLNQRKVKLIADMRDDLYRQALANGDIHAEH